MSKRILEEKNQEMLVAGAYLNFFFISREKTFNNWAPRPLSKKVAAKKVELSELKKGSSWWQITYQRFWKEFWKKKIKKY